MKKLLLFLIVLIPLFSFPTNVSAKNSLESQGVLNYSIKSGNLITNLSVTFTNNSQSGLVLNYYNILLPFQNISDLKVRAGGKQASFTAQKQKNGTEVVVNTGYKVITKKSSFTISFDFQSIPTIERDWSYAKLVGQISGLPISKINLETPLGTQVGYVEGARFVENPTSTKNIVSFTKISQPEISILFGLPITFEYQINKTVINPSNQRILYELPLPQTNASQTFILTSISPSISSSRVDLNNNILLKFAIEPEKQIVINIKGYIIKQKSKTDLYYSDFHTQNIGYWALTNQFEINRINSYLTNVKKEDYPQVLNNYVVNRFEIDKSNISKTNSFENSLRGGADVALGRKNNAVPEDYNDFLIALLRYKSIPARLVSGYIPISSSYSKNGFFHSWVEYFDLKNETWKIFDPSLQDSISSKTIYADSPNYISLLVRGENPLNPKLPFLSDDDISITPTSSTQISIFNVIKKGNNISNEGNIPVEVTDSSKSSLLLPNQEITPKGSVVSINSFKGDTKTIEFESEQSSSISNFNIFNESIIFFTFVLTLFVLNFIYSKMRKIWK